MSSFLYEIIELPNGDVALQHADENSEPVVSIRFSAESLYFLKGAKFEIAKAMIEAGLEAAGEMAEYEETPSQEEDTLLDMDFDPDSQVLH
jgi:hypothetical protein